jgi:hypothetical protein
VSHHPTSAELAAFRRSIPRRFPSVPGAPFRETLRGNAWPWERREGIGHTVGPRGNRIFSASDPGTEARAGAAAMRHAAFERDHQDEA